MADDDDAVFSCELPDHAATESLEWRFHVRSEGNTLGRITSLTCFTFSTCVEGNVGRDVWELQCELD